MDTQAPVLPTTTVYSAEHLQAASGAKVRQALPIRGSGLTGLDPFLQLDHSGPSLLGPSVKPRGTSAQPRKGFEAITMVYKGDLIYRDSNKTKTVLGLGDVHRASYGTGIVTEEAHGPKLTREGGNLETLQLWINLPAREKTKAPFQRALRADTLPIVPLSASGTNCVRLIAGHWQGYHGPLATATPMTLADVYLDAATETTITLKSEWSTGLYILSGSAEINGVGAGKHQLVKVHDEKQVVIKAFADTHLFFLSGMPIAEPIASYAGFILNTEDEVKLANAEYQDGLYGKL